MVSAVERFHYLSTLIKAMHFSFLLFVSTCHDHELIKVKH